MEERRSQVIEDRLTKLNALRAEGVEAYAYSYDVTHRTAEARASYEELEARNAAEAARPEAAQAPAKERHPPAVPRSSTSSAAT